MMQLLLILAFWANNSYTITGKAVKIIDGDTFDLLANGQVYRVRLNGIDCPERGQAYSRQAREALSVWCRSAPITVKYRRKDRNRRIIGDVYTAAGNWINLQLVQGGYAWHFKKYSTDRQLAKAEVTARNNRRGLWQDRQPVPPWVWRRR